MIEIEIPDTPTQLPMLHLKILCNNKYTIPMPKTPSIQVSKGINAPTKTPITPTKTPCTPTKIPTHQVYQPKHQILPNIDLHCFVTRQFLSHILLTFGGLLTWLKNAMVFQERQI